MPREAPFYASLLESAGMVVFFFFQNKRSELQRKKASFKSICYLKTELYK